MRPIRHRPGMHHVARGGAGDLERALRWLRLANARRAALREWKRGNKRALAAIRQRRRRPRTLRHCPET